MPINYVEVEEKKPRKKLKFPLWMRISTGVFVFLIIFTAALTIYFYPRVRVLAEDARVISSKTELLKKNIEEQKNLRQ